MIPFNQAPMTSYERSRVTVGLSRTDSDIYGDFRRKSPIFPNPHVFNAPVEGVPLELGIGAGVRRNQNDGATRVEIVLR